mmetsp:Transcript_25979/g.65513  ORF Transcript_25979/g.65513 Transcript_25979/m.65513 type:complete len:474 (+) Transcript_25979:29-1450(+)
MQMSALAVRPSLARSQAHAAPAPRRRVLVVRAAESRAPAAVDRRSAVGAALLSGVALMGSPAIAADVPAVPEPVARSVEASIAAVPGSTAPQLGPGAEAPALRPAAPLSPATASGMDPKLVSGGAAALVVVAGVAAAASQNTTEDAEAIVEAVAGMPATSEPVTKKDISKLKEVEDAYEAEKKKLKALQAEGAKLSGAFSDACLELNRQETVVAEARQATLGREAEASDAAKALLSAQSSLKAVAGKNAVQKFFAQLSGQSTEEEAQEAVDEAKAAVESATEAARKASITDRQLWVKQWRAATAVEAQRAELAAKDAAIDAQAAVVKAAVKAVLETKIELGLVSAGALSEASAEERSEDRRAWIASFKAKSGASGAAPAAASSEAAKPAAPVEAAKPAAASSEAGMGERQQDRRAWIASFKARGPANPAEPAAASSEASVEERLQDRRAWIAGYKARTPASVAKLEEQLQGSC